MTRPNPFTADNMPKHVRHGFFGREGGVSSGVYTSLNCGLGTDDDAKAVAENRARCAQSLGFAAPALLTLKQEHTNKIISITDNSNPGRVVGDGLVTNQAHILLGILTADCAPVLFADQHLPIIGAAHAGWKGALDGVLLNCVAEMRKLGATNIIAALGPTIAQASYEVSDAFLLPFLAQAPQHQQFFSTGVQHGGTRHGHWQFDLPAYIVAQLTAAGVAVSNIGQDTYSQPQQFFSYRRCTHKAEANYGRQLSAIGLSASQF